MKGYVLMEATKAMECQLGHSFYYEPGCLVYKKLKDAHDAAEEGQEIAEVRMEITENRWS